MRTNECQFKWWMIKNEFRKLNCRGSDKNRNQKIFFYRLFAFHDVRNIKNFQSKSNESANCEILLYYWELLITNSLNVSISWSILYQETRFLRRIFWHKRIHEIIETRLKKNVLTLDIDRALICVLYIIYLI